MKRNSVVTRYLHAARARNHEGYNNADGRFDDDLQFTGGQDFFQANGGRARRLPTSQPYIIQVASSSGSAVANFDILGAWQYLGNAGFSGGSLTIGSIVISSGLPGITYENMLRQFMVTPFTVGEMYIYSTTAGQITQTIQLETKDANGNAATKIMVPKIDPYQNQSTSLVHRQTYRVDGNTTLTINSIAANATVIFELYPTDNLNLARGLNGSPVTQDYGNPGIVRESVVATPGGISARVG